MSQDVNRNTKLFWKEMDNANGGELGSCNNVKDRTRMLCERLGRDILSIYIMWIQKNGLQSMCVVLLALEGVSTLRES